MLIPGIEKNLVEQIEREGYSSNLYLSMASWAEREGYPGIASWLYAQADEEREHMLKLIHFVNDRGGKALIPAFPAPTVSWNSVREIFVQSLEHEQLISKSINEIVALCLAEKDYTTHQWIQWFVAEQIEEESNVNAILDRLKLAGDCSLYAFDKEIMAMRASD